MALNNASASRVEEFFTPLAPTLYLDLSRPIILAGHRHKLSQENPHLIEAFSEELRDQIAEFRHLFFNIFNHFRIGEVGSALYSIHFRIGEVGSDVGTVCRAPFQLWCERSYIAHPESLHKRVEREFSTENVSASQLLRLFTNDFGFPSESAVAVAESLYAEYRKKRSAPEKRKELLWPLYEQTILNYATQTAHCAPSGLVGQVEGNS